MRHYLIFLLILIGFNARSQAVIKGQAEAAGWEVRYYEAINGFFNNVIYESVLTDAEGNFTIELDLPEPGTVRLYMGGWPILLFMEPGDELWIKNAVPNSFDQLEIRGNNAAGHLYYNRIFEETKMKKYASVEAVLDQVEGADLWPQLKEAMIQTGSWVDSLYNVGDISHRYLLLATDEIKALLGSLIARRTTDSFKLETYNNNILRQLISFLNVHSDTLLKTPGGLSFYQLRYLRYIYSLNPILFNPDLKFFSDNSGIGYQFAPPEIEPYISFELILQLYNFGTEEDFCKVYEKFESRFGPDNEYTEMLARYDFCSKNGIVSDFDESVIHVTKNEDFEDLIGNELRGKRWYIDFWATWCGPCKQVFRELPSNFYEILDKYDIHPLYISVDEPNRKSLWEQDIGKFGLKGTHILASPKLAGSVKEYVGTPFFMIPKYMIVSEEGEILNISAPRPIDIRMIEEFEKYFGEGK